MVAIEPRDLTGIDETRAWRLIAEARSIAPGLDLLVDPKRVQAVAIIQGAVAELPAPGSSRVRTMSRNGTSTGLDPYKSAFTDGDRAALRALCDTGSSGGLPQGSFPQGGIVERLWPERCSW